MSELYEDIYQEKFSFGKNWKEFLKLLTKERVDLAKKSLSSFIDVDIKGKTFVDIGCGSGLFSLSAALLGAKVTSVDVDANSVACAVHLRDKFKIKHGDWKIVTGSALDKNFIKGLGKFDIVYSWGVLHHTGNMWTALDNVTQLVKPKGTFYVALYNDFRGIPSSKTWLSIKRFYAKRGKLLRRGMEAVYLSYFFVGLILHGKNPFSYIKKYPQTSRRGMSFYRDAVDWLGGYPYEYASVEEVTKFYNKRGFELLKKQETAREGCNEFLFKK